MSSLCEGCSIELANLVTIISDKKKLITFLGQHDLIKLTLDCPHCGIELQIKDNFVFRCNRVTTIRKNKKVKKINCEFYRSAFKDTFFENAKIKPDKIINLIYLFISDGITQREINKKIKLSSATIVEWLHFAREVAIYHYKKHTEKLGGPEKILEIDEYLAMTYFIKKFPNVPQRFHEFLLAISDLYSSQYSVDQSRITAKPFKRKNSTSVDLPTKVTRTDKNVSFNSLEGVETNEDVKPSEFELTICQSTITSCIYNKATCEEEENGNGYIKLEVKTEIVDEDIDAVEFNINNAQYISAESPKLSEANTKKENLESCNDIYLKQSKDEGEHSCNSNGTLNSPVNEDSMTDAEMQLLDNCKSTNDTNPKEDIFIQVGIVAVEFSCDLCNYKSKTKSYLKKHLLTHARKNRYSCDQCGFKTIRKQSLRNHDLTHSREKPFSCQLCNYKAGRRETLRIHYLSHTGKTREYFCCQVCEFKTASKPILRKHILSHNEENPFTSLKY